MLGARSRPKLDRRHIRCHAAARNPDLKSRNPMPVTIVIAGE
ncbi:hypothetical protein LC55x_1601 [Lysobacter capsici]|nr:hypothetical protein LC55x_1601 [Lysobacter capsici]